MFLVSQTLPHGSLKIPVPAAWRCFEGEVPAEVITLAKEAGETAAKVEQVQAEQTEQAEKVETLENRLRWNDEALDAAFSKLYKLEDDVIPALEARILALESAQAADEDEDDEGDQGGDTGEGGSAEPEAEPPGTTLEPPGGSGGGGEPPKPKKHTWSLW